MEFRRVQLWRCTGCTHEFYTPVEKKQPWYRRLFRLREQIECRVCADIKAKKVRIVTKEIENDAKKDNS